MWCIIVSLDFEENRLHFSTDCNMFVGSITADQIQELHYVSMSTKLARMPSHISCFIILCLGCKKEGRCGGRMGGHWGSFCCYHITSPIDQWCNFWWIVEFIHFQANRFYFTTNLIASIRGSITDGNKCVGMLAEWLGKHRSSWLCKQLVDGQIQNSTIVYRILKIAYCYHYYITICRDLQYFVHDIYLFMSVPTTFDHVMPHGISSKWLLVWLRHAFYDIIEAHCINLLILFL